MANSYPGRLVHVQLAGSHCESSARLLDQLLERTEGVITYFIDPLNGTLTAYLDDDLADEGDLVRALVASGMYPTPGAPRSASGEEFNVH